MRKLVAIMSALLIVTICVACAPKRINSDPIFLQRTDSDPIIAKPIIDVVSSDPFSATLVGVWIVDVDGEPMLDPQTSGLKAINGKLYSVSDASADPSQTLRLHQISMDSGQVLNKFGPTTFSQTVKESCFINYLSTRPDYEGLVALGNNVWVFVTEDASRSEPLSESCQERYADSGSTVFPTLVVRLVLEGSQLVVTHVRPIRFAQEAQVGNFPNDGIEGLAVTKDNRLLLGLEKDANSQARVFELTLSEGFWSTPGFANAIDSQLLLPKFASGNHPINGMDVYYPNSHSQGYLLAAARNDSELWIIDLAKKKPTKRINLSFFAPSDTSAYGAEGACEQTHLMDNASLEGVAVADNKVWLVNDPWKRNYLKNVVCAGDQAKYEKMVPLLFHMNINDEWFE